MDPMDHMDHNAMDHSMHNGMDHSMHHEHMNHSMSHDHMNHSMHDMTTQDPHAHHHHHMSDNGGGHEGHQGHEGMDHGSMDHGMAMYFYASCNSTILFKGWTTDSWQTMLGSCLAIFIMACLYEGLKVFREVLLKRSQATQYTHAQNGDLQRVPTSDDAAAIVPKSKSVRNSMLTLGHFIQTLLHVLQVVISYFLMLIFMTYNVYLCIAVALGAGAGYFLFAWKRAMVVDLNEHCH